MVDRVRDGIDEAVPLEKVGPAVTLHEVVAGGDAVLVVAVTFHEVGVERRVAANRVGDQSQFVWRDEVVVVDARAPDGLCDHPVHQPRGRNAAGYSLRHDVGRQARIAIGEPGENVQ